MSSKDDEPGDLPRGCENNMGKARGDRDHADRLIDDDDIGESEGKEGNDDDDELTMKYPGVYVAQLNENDVLQGRGSGSNQHPGNIKYRQMIESIASSYVSTPSRKEKNRMVQQLVVDIHKAEGRFLHPVEAAKATALGLDPEKDKYFEITDEDAVEKSKQAIRYVHYKKRPMLEKKRRTEAEANVKSRTSSTIDRGSNRKILAVEVSHSDGLSRTTTMSGGSESFSDHNQQGLIIQLAQNIMPLTQKGQINNRSGSVSNVASELLLSQPASDFASRVQHRQDVPSSVQQHREQSTQATSSSSLNQQIIPQLLQQMLRQQGQQQTPTQQSFLSLIPLASQSNPSLINLLSNVGLQSPNPHMLPENEDIDSILLRLLRNPQQQQPPQQDWQDQRISTALQNLLPGTAQAQELSDDTSVNILRSLLVHQQQQQHQFPYLFSRLSTSRASHNEDQRYIYNALSNPASRDAQQLTHLLSRIASTSLLGSNNPTGYVTNSRPIGVSSASPHINFPFGSGTSAPLPHQGAVGTTAPAPLASTLQQQAVLQQVFLLQQQQLHRQQQLQQEQEQHFSGLVPAVRVASTRQQASPVLQVTQEGPSGRIVAYDQTDQYISRVQPQSNSLSSSSISGDSAVGDAEGREERKSRSRSGDPASKRPRLQK